VVGPVFFVDVVFFGAIGPVCVVVIAECGIV
jgi:hypothetical protein